MLLEVLLKVDTPLIKAIGPTEPYKKPVPLQTFRGSRKNVVPGIRPETSKSAGAKKVKLGEYPLDKETREAFYSAADREEDPRVAALDAEGLTR